MSVTTDEIHRIAHLARLHIQPEQVVRYQENLNNLLQLIEQLTAVDTQHILPMAHPLPNQTARLRPDVAVPVTPQEQGAFQAIAPSILEGLYLVPKVIE